MFRVRLILDKKAHRWSFRVGQGFRITNVLTAVAVLAAGWFLEAPAMALALGGLALLGALYEESALFDQATNRAEFRLGLILFHRTRVFPLTEVAEVHVSSFGAAPFVGLEVILKDGTAFTIEKDRGKASKLRLTAWAEDLAQWLGVPVVSEAL